MGVCALRETRGATLLMALLALLVAAMVSAVILAAATSAVKQVKDDRDFQQSQLYLQSAAQYVLDDVAGAANDYGNRAGRIVVEIPWVYKEDSQGWVADLGNTKVSSESPLDKMIGKAYRESQYASPSSPHEFSIDFEANNEKAAGNQMHVKARFALKRNAPGEGAYEGDGYKLMYTFWTDDPKQTLYLTMTAEELVSPNFSDTTKPTSGQYRFTSGEFSISGNEGSAN